MGSWGRDVNCDDPVLSSLVQCAIAIIDEEGAGALTMRELGARSHRSASTISYHAAPFEQFKTLVWHHIERQLEARVHLSASADEAQRRRGAESAITWTKKHPYLAEFFITHSPDPELIASGVATSPADRAHVNEPASTRHRLAARAASRHLQTALELAIRLGGQLGTQVLDSELRHIAASSASILEALSR